MKNYSKEQIKEGFNKWYTELTNNPQDFEDCETHDDQVEALTESLIDYIES